MLLELNRSLKPASYSYSNRRSDILRRTLTQGPRRGRDIVEGATERLVATTIPIGIGEPEIVYRADGMRVYEERADRNAPRAGEYHANYLEYLAVSWAKHDSITITPDIVWYAVLCELAAGVLAHPEPHRPLFTKSLEKIELTFSVNEPSEILPLDDVLLKLTEMVPIDISLFLPMFSTSTNMTYLAAMAAFAEMCTPYYSYSTFACGHRSVRIEGEISDYMLIVKQAMALLNEFRRVSSPLERWMNETLLPWVTAIEHAVIGQDTDFFSKIFSARRCGSGGEIDIDGWWSRLAQQQPNGIRKPDNFPSHISRVPWRNKDSDRRFTLNFGLFYSNRVEGILVPEFGWVQNEVFA